MAGWTAVAGTHDFVVLDEGQARALAQALAGYGFALVTANPSWHEDGWTVTAFDEGPYSNDVQGRRTMDAVGRGAAALARQHHGYPQGGVRCDPTMLTQLHAAEAAIEYANPGARPPTPAVVVRPMPPPAPLALTPDRAEDIPIDLSGLDGIAWGDLEHAHGDASDIPGLLRTLADPFCDWEATLDELFGDNLLHQGTCYSATAPVMPFLTRMITSGALPARQRLDLYAWLLTAADCQAADLLADADRAAAHHRQPEAAAWAPKVHAAVDGQMPTLLARWDTEPPAIRAALACLAAAFPHHGRQLGDEIAAMAASLRDTQPGAYLRLAHAMVRADDDQTLTLAADIVAWAPDHDPGWLEATGVTITIKTSHIIARGALRILSNTK
ncbi:hypothetical protein AB0M79_33995 [Polymorphospora sp. NPDC051019]|uniref:hypothetical protein n=1 Tax=Polymorphospora sp. NPDC051019 TaxID=3155725 RepID=UPI003436C703